MEEGYRSSGRRGKASGTISTKKKKKWYKVPNLQSSTHETIMFGFHRVPKSEQDIAVYERMRSAVPEENDTNDTIFKRWTNKIQSKVISEMKYMHCEIAFNKSLFENTSDAPDTAIAYGVFNTTRDGKRGEVWVKERTYMSPYYDWIFLSVPRKMAYKCAQFHQDQVGKPFDAAGLRGVYTTPVECDGKAWFCVSLHMCGAEYAGIIEGYINVCTKTTVDEFYDIMSKNKYRVSMKMIPLDQHRSSKCTVDSLLEEIPSIKGPTNTKGRRAASTPQMKEYSTRRKSGARSIRGHSAFERVTPGISVPQYSSSLTRRKKRSTGKYKTKKPNTTIINECFLPE